MRGWLLLGLMGIGLVATRAEDEAEGEDGVVFDDVSNAVRVDKCVIESCAGWRLNRLPEVKAFIFQDFENKFDKTKYKEIPGKAPEAVFYNSLGKELERLNIENFNREQLNQLMLKKGIPSKQSSGQQNKEHEEQEQEGFHEFHEFQEESDGFEFMDGDDGDYFQYEDFNGHDEF